MEISFAQCETILNTLPIGYYTGRRINTTLDEKEETSFYSPIEDSIVISYPIIAERVRNASDSINLEEAVRSMLYHEVSHAILTSPHLIAYDWMNIFEDERIETLLRDYYMDVDFKKQLFDLCGGTVHTPTNGKEAFFNAVRFRIAPEEILKEISNIIERYKNLNRLAGASECRNYYNAVHNLYNRICKDYASNPENYQSQDSQEGEEGQQKSPDKLKNNSEAEEQKKGTGSNISANGENNDGESDSELGMEDARISPEQMRSIAGKMLNRKVNLSDEQIQELDEFTKTAEMIINNFNKKNKNGSGISAYSGVFNPRAVARQDYRFFERAMSTQGNNKFGTCHLNLFIDCSGSMTWNENIVNGILSSLSEVERKNKNFTIDVSFINENYYDCKSVRDRRFNADGGNSIPEDMKERFLKRQLPNTCNYNIVLFDGDAFSDDCNGIKSQIKRFSAFDYKQTTLITDPDNEEYLGNGFHSTKVIITKDYAKELITHVTKALTVAFG